MEKSQTKGAPKLKKTFRLNLTIILIIISLESILSCTKIELFAKSFSSSQEKVEEAGFGDDPASRIAAETVVRNSLEFFIDSETIYENIYFGPNSADLDEAAKAILWKKILWLEENPGMVLVIEGHSDSSGPETDNLVMGIRRADSVKKFLIELGANSERLITISYGEEHLVDMGKNAESQAKNRRVSFSIR